MLLVLVLSLGSLSLSAGPGSAASARDPFASMLDGSGEAEPKPPLLRTKLEDMRLEGVVAGTAAPRALVALKDGTSWVIHVGAALGTNGGRVVAIRPGVVVVREEFVDVLGQRHREDVELSTR